MNFSCRTRASAGIGAVSFNAVPNERSIHDVSMKNSTGTSGKSATIDWNFGYASVIRASICWATLSPCERMKRSLLLRSEEHTSELQSLMRISYAVFCLKKNTTNKMHVIITAHIPIYMGKGQPM